MKIRELQAELTALLETHPLYCPECQGWKHANEVICEQCRIDITVENTSII